MSCIYQDASKRHPTKELNLREINNKNLGPICEDVDPWPGASLGALATTELFLFFIFFTNATYSSLRHRLKLCLLIWVSIHTRISGCELMFGRF